MTGVEIGLTALALMLVLIALRMPIGPVLVGVSFCGLWALMGWNVAWGSLGVIPYQFSANWVLSSVPMFLLLGFICYHTQLTQGLFNAARLWLSGLPGGLAIAAIFGSAGFAAVSGSSVACSATMGRIAIPEMLKAKYHPELATGTVAVAGTIGALIPPSIILILYGIVAQVPVTQLFLGGIAAGIMTAIGYVLVVLIRVRLNPALAPSVADRADMSEKLAALRETWPVILLMIGIFGGLFSGVFTPTEAGAVGAALATLIAALRGSFSWVRFTDAIMETVLTTSTLIIIGIGASLLTRFLALSGTGDFMSDLVLSADAGPLVILLGIVLLYLLLGLFLEPIGAMLLTLPIVLPIVSDTGFELLWFGIILTKLLEIGMITPPIGMNVFVIKGVVGNLVSTSAIFRGILWFLVMDLVVLGILILLPELILFLPRILG
ncbi:TRAP transporter large permease [Phaeobacter gallaeciensis]|uniref:TRAP transporter large permease n=1 Tax=Phaeobacter gallaeciensis TaxID=60890 RepID=UPI00238003EB|nr:TRAP transporter large permease [Phaeobacter gallaeciensis]MDE4276788.1 TRAP transporter large permease [Phaeobacter gallaeciensis]MDE4302010.1 TRAP transporter large permease [Phaeobacter gallaeciensis]MDE5187212.1 TRAP transporter large permease [Phaeobacter gallaeciensis]